MTKYMNLIFNKKNFIFIQEKQEKERPHPEVPGESMERQQDNSPKGDLSAPPPPTSIPISPHPVSLVLRMR